MGLENEMAEGVVQSQTRVLTIREFPILAGVGRGGGGLGRGQS